MNVTMRHDHCLIRIKQLEKVGSLHMPDSAVQGKEFVVEAIGPEVENLSVGDKVLMKGVYGADYYELPSDKNLIVIQEKNIVMVFHND